MDLLRFLLLALLITKSISSGIFWPDILKITASKRLCLVKEFTDDKAVSDIQVIHQAGYEASLFSNITDLLSYCEITAQTIVALNDLHQSNVGSVLGLVSQSQLRNNLWFIATGSNKAKAIDYFKSNRRRFDLRITMFFFNLGTLEVEQVFGTANTHMDYKVSANDYNFCDPN